MPTQEINDILSTIDNSVTTFVDGLPDAQKTIYDRVMALVKQLDTDPGGNIKNNIANIRILQLLQSAIHDVVMTDDYKKRIGAFTKTFDDIAQLQNKYLSTIFDKFSPTPVLAQITQASMDYTMDSLGDAGLSNDLANEVKDVLNQNIMAGAKFSDMADQIRTSIQGNDQIDGALVRYAKTYAIDSVNTFNAAYNRQVTSDFQAVWYRYVGTNKDTTRPFCDALTHKNQGFFHVSEIPGFLNGEVGTDTVPLYDKTGLPQGMKDGTTVSTFFTNRGGWNCNHQIFPVSRLSVPQDLRNKYPDDTKPETGPPKSQQPQPAPQPAPAPAPKPVTAPKLVPTPQPKPVQASAPKPVVPETIGVTKQELVNTLTRQFDSYKVNVIPTPDKINAEYHNSILKTAKEIYPNIDFSRITENPTYSDIYQYILKNAPRNSDVIQKITQLSFQGVAARINGFDKKPLMVSKDQFDTLKNSGDYIEIRRGLKDIGNLTVKDQIDQFKNGELFNGKGIFGDGTYFDRGTNLLGEDFGISRRYADGIQKNVFSALIPKNAKIISFKEAEKLRSFYSYQERLFQQGRIEEAQNEFEAMQLKGYDSKLLKTLQVLAKNIDPKFNIGQNEGSLMTALGYDAIEVNERQETMIMNDKTNRVETIKFLAKYLVMLNRSSIIVHE